MPNKAPHHEKWLLFDCVHCQIISVRDHSFGLICYKASVTKWQREGNFPFLLFCVRAITSVSSLYNATQKHLVFVLLFGR